VKYLVVSDIHANLQALEAVIAAADPIGWDRVLVLGDLVGYGADPNAVIERVQALEPEAVIRGNHDKAACGIDDGSNFNQIARYAAAWTADTLQPAYREYLKDLPAGPQVIDDVLEICHGAPFDEDHYIFDATDARRGLGSARRPLCLFGHTHLPVVFEQSPSTLDGFIPNERGDTVVELASDMRYLVNVGSVGQPRDGDPRAAFAIYDADARVLLMRRVPYDVQSAQRRILSAGLPASLANRLAIGR
jgi:diadenosine tetraphosphatase ApaH/serine/threonine PP2A family protein phosphatase